MTQKITRNYANFTPAISGVVDPGFAFFTQINALVADIAALRTTINAIITAAATNIGAVAAVTPAAAGTGVTLVDDDNS